MDEQKSSLRWCRCPAGGIADVHERSGEHIVGRGARQTKKFASSFSRGAECKASEKEVTLVKAAKKDMPFMKSLFLSAFPPEERPPFFMLRICRKENVKWWTIRYKGQNAGFFYVVDYKDISYVFYFAIEKSMRGCGIGTAAMKKLKRQNRGRRLFLAIEPPDENAPNPHERIARKNFYCNCGLYDMHQKLREGRMIYAMLGTGGIVSDKEYKTLMKKWLPFPLKFIFTFGITE